MTPEEKPMTIPKGEVEKIVDKLIDRAKFFNQNTFDRQVAIEEINQLILSREQAIVEEIKQDMANDFEHRTGFHVGTKHWRLGMNRAIDIIEGRVSRKS